MDNGICRYCGLHLDNHVFRDETLACPERPNQIAILLTADTPPTAKTAPSAASLEQIPPDYELGEAA